MSLIITYNGSQLANSSTALRLSLNTAGTYCADNIIVDYTAQDDIIPVKDGKTRIYITIPAGADLSKLSVPLYWNQDVSEGVIIDWGDGSPTETVSGTGNVHAPTPHTYGRCGQYVITMTRVGNCTIQLGNGSDTTGLLGTAVITANTSRSVLTGIETGDGVTTLQAYCCCRCGGIRTLIFGKDITTLGNYVCAYAWEMAGIHFLGTLPDNNNIGSTTMWDEIPPWCRVFVPMQYIMGGAPTNIPARLPSTSTYTYAVEPYAYPVGGQNE